MVSVFRRRNWQQIGRGAGITMRVASCLNDRRRLGLPRWVSTMQVKLRAKLEIYGASKETLATRSNATCWEVL